MTTTYIPLATTTLASATNTVTLSSISASYTDLVLIINYQASGGAVYAQYRLNGDSGSNYRRNVISGNGSSAANYTSGSESYMYAANTIYAASGQWATLISNFNNYSNTTTNKTAIHRFSEANIGTEAAISSWNSTAAINSITINTNANNFGIGSTFSLYGIASAAVVSGAKATGGDIISTDGTYWYHAFRASGTFTPSSTLSCDVLVVAGGGGGGNTGGGGGAGGVFYATSQSLASGTGYTATIGAGGAGGAIGVDSTFASLTAAKGGGIGGAQSSAGGAGGSGGGSWSNNAGGATTQTGTGGTGYGFVGGGSLTASAGHGGGGAGASGGLSPVSPAAGGNGGAGLNTWSAWLNATGTGVSGYIAGGGGGIGQPSTTPATGGAGGGGAGAAYANDGTAGTANTGGGGGAWVTTPRSGGSGLVIVRYPI
jgi:hypothetical protein